MLLTKSHSDLQTVLGSSESINLDCERRHLLRAMSSLRRCRECEPNKINELPNLFWDSWGSTSRHENGHRIISREPSNDHQQHHQQQQQQHSPHYPHSEALKPPSTPFNRGPLIAHRFTKKFKALSTCDFCSKQMFFGLKCIECKYRCHKDCESSVPPSCGIPPELMNEFKQTFGIDVNQASTTSPEIVDAGNGFFYSSRGNTNQVSTTQNTSSRPPISMPTKSNNRLSQTPATLKSYLTEWEANAGDDNVIQNEPITVQGAKYKEQPSKMSTTSLTGSTANSVDSMQYDSTDVRQSEWGIQFDSIKLLENIGRGRFGTVHRGQWHGDVAVKLLNEDYLDDGRTIEAFKQEVATYRNTRHANLVLFMGFCMKPKAIVTSLCKGNTLYTHIHLRKDKFNLFRASLVAQQISQGMSYLHAKEIIHKDLTTRNIFLENVYMENLRVVITDFGLFSATKLQYGSNGLHIPNNWLCYLAPELLRGLRQTPPTHYELQLSKGSDIYAFGTVWYEILCGEFPFKQQPPEAIIFQIGCGMKQTLANVQAARDVKEILMFCWAFQRDDRPDFSRLHSLLVELPKKQMPKTSTRTMHLSMSAESVF